MIKRGKIDKRGLSEVVGTVLIILLVIAAVVVMWIAIRQILETDFDFTLTSMAIDESSAKVNDLGTQMSIAVKNTGDETFTGAFKFIIEDEFGNYYYEIQDIKSDYEFKSKETWKFDLPGDEFFNADPPTLLTDYLAGEIVKVTVAPILKQGNREKTSPFIDDTDNIQTLPSGQDLPDSSGGTSSRGGGASDPDPPADCEIVTAVWDTTSAVEGNPVGITLTGTNCDGQTVTFEVFDNQIQPIPDTPAQVNPASAIFSSGTATTTWLSAELGDDWFFDATVAGIGTTRATNRLVVSAAPDCVEDDTRVTTCGVGECAGNTGIETCTGGVWGGDTCDPLAGATAEVCTGNLDEDCDGDYDCSDSDCSSDPACTGGGTLSFATGPTENLDPVPLYEKFEISFTLSDVYTNPFDPDEVQVDAIFTSADGLETFTVPGFWYKEFSTTEHVDGWEFISPVAGTEQWKIRFAANQVSTGIGGGDWDYVIRVIDQSGTRTRTSGTYHFEVSDSTNPGYVRVSSTDSRYFEFDDGSLFYGIGPNLCHAGSRGKTYSYEDWLTILGNHDSNFIRVWNRNSLNATIFCLEHGGNRAPSMGDIIVGCNYVYSLEDNILGQYDLEDGWRMDELFDQAELEDIYVMLTLDKAEPWDTGGDWNLNLFNPQCGDDHVTAGLVTVPCNSGGFLSDPQLYFTDSTAQEYYQKLLRYYIARWGYSTSLHSWEFYNEIGSRYFDLNVGGQVDAWYGVMEDYLEANDPYNHMISTSDGSEANTQESARTDWSMPEMDYAQAHGYIFDDGSGYDDISDLINAYTWIVTTDNKPGVWGENGVVEPGNWQWSCYNHYNAAAHSKCSGITSFDAEGKWIHDAIWISPMIGLAASPMSWDWEIFASTSLFYDNYQALSNFMAGENLINQGYSSISNAVVAVTGEYSTDFENSADDSDWRLTDNTNNWAIDSTDAYSGTRSLHWIAGLTSEEDHAQHRFCLDPSTEYDLSGWAKTISVNSGKRHLKIIWGGQSVYAAITLPGTTTGSDWEYFSTTFTTDSSDCPIWGNEGVDVDMSYASTGEAWIDDISITKVSQPQGSERISTTNDNLLKVYGQKNSDGGIFWIHNIQSDWVDVITNGIVPNDMNTESITIPGMRTSYSFTVEWWNTWTGAIISTQSVSSDSSGDLTLALPDSGWNLNDDIAVKVYI